MILSGKPARPAKYLFLESNFQIQQRKLTNSGNFNLCFSSNFNEIWRRGQYWANKQYKMSLNIFDLPDRPKIKSKVLKCQRFFNSPHIPSRTIVIFRFFIKQKLDNQFLWTLFELFKRLIKFKWLWYHLSKAFSFDTVYWDNHAELLNWHLYFDHSTY